MNKFKNILRDKFIDFKRFISDNKKVSAFFCFLIISFGLYFIVFAEGDATFNLSVTSSAISSSSDVSSGSLPNFGNVDYEINYNITSSDSETIPTVYAHIYIPESFEVTIPGLSSSKTVTINSIKYKYYKQTISNDSLGERQKIIQLTNVNSVGGETTFSPIIQLDLNDADISNPNNCLSDDIKNITITSKLDYHFKAISGTSFVKDNKIYIPIGVFTYIPYSDENGIKGYANVSTVEYNVTNSSNVNLVNPKDIGISNGNYAYDEKFSSEHPITNFPNYENGRITVSGDSVNIKNVAIDMTKIHTFSDNTKGILLSSNVFVYCIENMNSEQFEFNFTAKNSTIDRSDSTKGVVYKNRTVGYIESKITFDNNLPSFLPKEFVYGADSFNFNVSNTYSTEFGGNALDDLDSFIKFDSSITEVKLEEITMKKGEGEAENITSNFDINYYIIPWDTVSINSTCSSSSLNSDQKMNLFAGPCSPFTSQQAVNEKTDGITTIKISSKNSHFSFDPGAVLNYKISAKIKDQPDLIDKKLQIVTINASQLSLDSNSHTYFYLGNKIVNTSNETVFKNPNSYDKNKVCSDGTNCFDGIIGNTILVKAGILNNVETSTWTNIKELDDEGKEITILNKMGEEDNPFYAGKDEPIVWRILPVSTKGSSTNIDEANIIIKIPRDTNGNEYLNFNDAYLAVSNSSIINENTSSSFDKVLCSETGDVCKYSINKDENTITFTIKNKTDNLTTDSVNASDPINYISYLVNNGLFLETNIDLIASSGDVGLDVDFTYSFKTGENQTTSNFKASPKTKIAVIRSKLTNAGRVEPEVVDINTEYTYYMNSIISEEQINPVELIYVLPYNDELNKRFNGTYNITINKPDNYTLSYVKTSSSSSRNINELINATWEPYTSDTALNNENILAIKITSPSNEFLSNQIPKYFGGKRDSVNVKITPSNNAYGDKYENVFYTTANGVTYDTKTTVLSTYNRSISGIIFEDYDYDGFYSQGENIIKDLSIELYKVSKEDFRAEEKNEGYIDKGTLVGEAIFSTEEGYNFEKLEAGYYFVKIKYNSDYYELTDFNKIDYSVGGGEGLNSKFKLGEESGYAYSTLLNLGNDKTDLNYSNINLGLKIKKAFAIDINKYIKNIKVIKSTGVENYDYDKAKQVKLDFRDLVGTTFEVTYGFDLKNSRYYPGYVGVIVEAIPEEMIFDPSLNEGWQESDKLLYYNGLSDTIIMPDQTYSFEIKLKIPENLAGNFINIISAGDLRMLETAGSSTNNDLENAISNLGLEEDKEDNK